MLAGKQAGCRLAQAAHTYVHMHTLCNQLRVPHSVPPEAGCVHSKLHLPVGDGRQLVEG
jgi:hypothetical protein